VSKVVVVVDYGMGNVKSVIRGVEQTGAKVILTSDPDEVRNAERVILPGVGAFEDGMKELRQRDMDSALRDFIKTERPLLGICLGMQMFFDESGEHGKHQGLGFISGRVVNIPQEVNGTVIRKIPHIGWSALHLPNHRENWDKTMLESTNVGDAFYFVHSFMAVPDNSDHILAQCEYEQLPITAAVTNHNITGCQFHPEKSGEYGLKIVDRFLTL
jgi:glutamine amidotransferase